METERDFEYVINQLKTFSFFDKPAIDQLLEDTGPLLVLRILARFYLSVEEALKHIEDGMRADEADPIWKACHKLVGSAELLGFKEFGQKSRRLNSDIKAMPEVHLHTEELRTYMQLGNEVLGAIHQSFPGFKSYL